MNNHEHLIISQIISQKNIENHEDVISPGDVIEGKRKEVAPEEIPDTRAHHVEHCRYPSVH